MPVRSDRRDGECVSQTIVRALAEAEGTAPMQLSPPIYEAINPEALNQFIHSLSTDDSGVSFEYNGYGVLVSGNGDVEVTPLSDSETSNPV